MPIADALKEKFNVTEGDTIEEVINNMEASGSGSGGGSVLTIDFDTETNIDMASGLSSDDFLNAIVKYKGLTTKIVGVIEDSVAIEFYDSIGTTFRYYDYGTTADISRMTPETGGGTTIYSYGAVETNVKSRTSVTIPAGEYKPVVCSDFYKYNTEIKLNTIPDHDFKEITQLKLYATEVADLTFCGYYKSSSSNAVNLYFRNDTSDSITVPANTHLCNVTFYKLATNKQYPTLNNAGI